MSYPESGQLQPVYIIIGTFLVVHVLQEAELRTIHQEWVNEALNSGPAGPAAAADWEGALKRGLARAAKRS
jgi:hypothetical protein